MASRLVADPQRRPAFSRHCISNGSAEMVITGVRHTDQTDFIPLVTYVGENKRQLLVN